MIKKPPINFDFGRHWQSKVQPCLDDVRLTKAIKKGLNDYFKYFDLAERYKEGTCPANCSSLDYYPELMLRREEELLEKLRREGKLPQCFLDLEELVRVTPHDSKDIDDLLQELGQAESRVVEPYLTWDKIKYDLESYYFLGGSFWYSPTFGLTLAKLVCPEQKWRVLKNETHATVINEQNTMIFDLMYWGFDGRIENYMFGDPIGKVDPTLGGFQAFIDAS